ncbi:MAG: peptidoglycan recognition protein family protein [Caulobacteraceae bacterium]
MTPIAAPSPNFDARVGPPDMIVLHYTGMISGEAALERLTDSASKVSAHYLIEEDGRPYALVPEERRAWHAGVAFWAGASDINGASIGIELVNPGHEFGYRPYPDDQIVALLGLLDDIRARWTVPNARILAHSDLAPARKADPGELFPWGALAAAGHGLWAEPPPAPGAPLSLGAEGPGVFALQAGLASLGYACRPSGLYDDETRTLVAAFQRHWVQGAIDGVADGAVRARLIALLRLARGR